MYGWDLDFTGGDEKVLKKYEWLKDEFNSTLLTYREFLSAFTYRELSLKKKMNSKILETTEPVMRIAPIVWNGIIWMAEKELGRHR